MALEQFPSRPDSEDRLPWLTRDPEDRMLARYIEWRADARSVNEAYHTWRQAIAGEAGRRFATYLAALEREEVSAGRYAVAVADVQCWLGTRKSR